MGESVLDLAKAELASLLSESRLEIEIDSRLESGVLHIEATVEPCNKVSRYVVIAMRHNGKRLWIKTGIDSWEHFTKEGFYLIALEKALNLQ